jgi:hypothetical protein
MFPAKPAILFIFFVPNARGGRRLGNYADLLTDHSNQANEPTILGRVHGERGIGTVPCSNMRRIPSGATTTSANVERNAEQTKAAAAAHGLSVVIKLGSQATVEGGGVGQLRDQDELERLDRHFCAAGRSGLQFSVAVGWVANVPSPSS